uniref:Tc1-like transposase DDE domain-containing protein n=1 Tax=Amphimedon queenslandica TaxID=400682 RepID=A0A1X7UDF4_AMPQE
MLTTRQKLGWTFRGGAYCQIIRVENKSKRLQRARDNLNEYESNGRRENLQNTSQGQSTLARCTIGLVREKSNNYFEGIMNGAGLIHVFKAELLPYINNIDNNVRLLQDNDPKHMSKRVREWLEANDINWWLTPPESPNIEPFENFWHDLKEYLRRVVKPKTKHELVTAVFQFWDIVDINKCRKYIKHLRKVIPKI